MSSLRVIIELLRIKQWYKNIIIFLPLVFSLNLFSVENFSLSIVGFFALCLVSSASYIRNDVKDIEIDKLDPHKSKRPLASGKISLKIAYRVFAVCIIVGFLISFLVDWKFGVMTVLLFVSIEVYSKWLKNIIFLDVLSISGNYIIRALSGVILIQSKISPWLVLGVFFVALFLAFLKRKHELSTLKELADKHRSSLKNYDVSILDAGLTTSTSMIIITYSLYAMNSVTNDWRLIITVPIIVYILFRQIYLVKNGKIKSVSESVIEDKSILVALFVYGIITTVLLYSFPLGYFN